MTYPSVNQKSLIQSHDKVEIKNHISSIVLCLTVNLPAVYRMENLLSNHTCVIITIFTVFKPQCTNSMTRKCAYKLNTHLSFPFVNLRDALWLGLGYKTQQKKNRELSITVNKGKSLEIY